MRLFFFWPDTTDFLTMSHPFLGAPIRWLAIVLAMALPAPHHAAATQQHALLVGVSSYPSLPENLQLHGPANDVPLMRNLLLQRGFTPKNIRVLADGVAGAGEPTRAAIMGELKALAGRAGKGDFVFLFFAGHGSQQPARDIGPQNPEPDGLDEIFLPRDIGKWSGAVGSVQNAIVDDELGLAITAIRNRGAFVWAVFDTCHSGTITRGIPDESVRYRDVRPQALGIPDSELARAAKEAAALVPRTRGAEGGAPMTGVMAARAGGEAGGFVVFYAAQSWERAPEERLPAGHPDRRSHGVFTFALAQTLAMNPSMTYRQAAQQILQRYRGRNQGQPTPLFEGPSLDAPVFGATAGAQVQQWRIEKDERTGTLRIGAGALHQLSEGAVFAVMRGPAAPDKEALGYVSATRVEVLQSAVEPTDYGGKPKMAAAAIPDDAYARLVNPNLSLVLRVALPPSVAKPAAHDAKAKAVLDQLAKEKPAGLAVSWLPAREGGDIRLLVRDDKLWLLPPSAELIAEGPHKSLSIDLVKNDAKQLREKLLDSLRSIAKVVNLLRLASQSSASPVAQKVELTITVERGGKPFPFNPNQVPALFDRDQLSIRVSNRHTQAVDVTVLFIDSQYGITSIFPRSGESNRVVPNGQLTLGKVEINVDTVGRESLLFIVAEAEPGAASADFSFLQQERLAVTRGAGQAAAGDLHAILENIGFAPERTRGVRVAKSTLDRTAIRLYTWDTTARR
ncbi:MAG TPA: caspase family protein [Burkholderiales bacterium]|nr:caspase family protein [Burkholderiales bacterium]